MLSTIVSYVFVSIPWMISNVFKYVFHRSLRQFVKEVVVYFFVACIVTFLCWISCRATSGMLLWEQIIINLILSVILSNIVMFVIYKENKYYNQMIELVDKITKFKLTKVLKMIKK